MTRTCRRRIDGRGRKHNQGRRPEAGPHGPPQPGHKGSPDPSGAGCQAPRSDLCLCFQIVLLKDQKKCFSIDSPGYEPEVVAVHPSGDMVAVGATVRPSALGAWAVSVGLS